MNSVADAIDQLGGILQSFGNKLTKDQKQTTLQRLGTLNFIQFEETQDPKFKKQSLLFYAKALKLSPNNPDLLSQIGLCY